MKRKWMWIFFGACLVYVIVAFVEIGKLPTPHFMIVGVLGNGKWY